VRDFLNFVLQPPTVMKKHITLLIFLLAPFLASAQHFELFKLPKKTRHVPFTRMEVHQDSLFYMVESTSLPGRYGLAKFKTPNVRATLIPEGYQPTKYHMVSFKKDLYIVLKNSSDRHFLMRYNGRTFRNVPLPPGYTFSDVEELEVYRGEIILGLENEKTSEIDLFRFNGTTFTNIALCEDCHLGTHPEWLTNMWDDMIEYDNKLYLVGYMSLDSATWRWKQSLFVYDGSTMSRVSEPFAQWWSRWDHFFIYNGLLHSQSFSGFDGTTTVPVPFVYSTVSGGDPVSMPWLSPLSDHMGKTVYHGAVYNAPYMPFLGPEEEFLRHRIYSYSTDPAKAREIFLPGDYYVPIFDEYTRSHMIVYDCRLFMILVNAVGEERLVAYRDTRFTICDFRFPFPIPFPPRFTIYPNPGHGLFTIEIPEQAKGVQFMVRVFNNKGELVLQKTIDDQNNTIDLQSFGKGLYMAYFEHGEPLRLIVK
jgi:Secretion system C-terminal sorting domain